MLIARQKFRKLCPRKVYKYIYSSRRLLPGGIEFYFNYIMSKPSFPQPTKLLASLIFSDNEAISAVSEELSREFGKIDFFSEKFPFLYTDYYQAEMGDNLARRIISFEILINPDSLPGIKLKTNLLESKYPGDNHGRKINIDPGYLSLSHLILATTKESPHRPYLRDGIYADLTLLYENQTFRALKWTYPDYASQEIIKLMNLIRKKYLFQLRNRS